MRPASTPQHLANAKRNKERCKQDPECRERMRVTDKARNDRKAEHSRVARYHRLYNLSEKQLLQMAADQGGACAICGYVPDPSTAQGVDKRLHVDHNHKTGEVRGLLCRACNTGIGLLQDSPKVLRKAEEYLERGGYEHRSRTG
jgi:hypothetical protein